MSKHISMQSRRQFMKKTAFFAGLAPLVTFTLPSFSPLAAFTPAYYPASAISEKPVTHGLLVIDTTLTMRARLIADHLAGVGYQSAAIEGIGNVPYTITRLQSQSGRPIASFNLIGLGNGVSHVLALAQTGQFTTLILDTVEPIEQDLSASFEMLKTASIKTLIVHDLSAQETLWAVTRFLERSTERGF